MLGLPVDAAERYGMLAVVPQGYLQVMFRRPFPRLSRVQLFS